jgi:hypothetical protein
MFYTAEKIPSENSWGSIPVHLGTHETIDKSLWHTIYANQMRTLQMLLNILQLLPVNFRIYKICFQQ